MSSAQSPNIINASPMEPDGMKRMRRLAGTGGKKVFVIEVRNEAEHALENRLHRARELRHFPKKRNEQTDRHHTLDDEQLPERALVFSIATQMQVPCPTLHHVLQRRFTRDTADIATAL